MEIPSRVLQLAQSLGQPCEVQVHLAGAEVRSHDAEHGGAEAARRRQPRLVIRVQAGGARHAGRADGPRSYGGRSIISGGVFGTLTFFDIPSPKNSNTTVRIQRTLLIFFGHLARDLASQYGGPRCPRIPWWCD